MRTAERRVLLGAIAGLAFGLCLVGSLLAAFHEPAPHELPVAVVAPTGVLSKTQAALDAQQPGAFRLDSYPTAQAARAAVTDGSHHGAFVVGAQGDELMVAGAGGSAPVSLLTKVFTKVSAAEHQPLRVTDVVPLPEGDRQGLSSFFVVLGLVFSSLVFGAVSTLAGRGSRLVVHVSALIGFAALLGSGAAFLADDVLGALTGHYLLLAGLLALFSLSVAAPTAALARISPRAAALAVLTFIVLGVPSTGGPAGLSSFLPALFRSLNPVLPMSEVISGIASAHYFGGHSVAKALLVLGTWAVAGLVVLLVAGSVLRGRHNAGRHAGLPRPAPTAAQV